jgi:hypothetical protein
VSFAVALGDLVLRSFRRTCSYAAALAAILAAGPVLANAQAQSDGNLGTIVRASAPGGDNDSIFWAHADPTDGQHLIICGMFSYPQLNASYGYVYSSPDAGATWRRTLLDVATKWVSEESCTYGENGRAYFADGESDTSTGVPRHKWGHLQLFASDDHGMTWKRAGRRGFVDWTFLAAIPAAREHPSSLLIFGNWAADEPGHQVEKRPVVMQASDEARSISRPLTTPTSYFGTYAGGSVVLPDRTALFISGLRDTDKDNGYFPGADAHDQLRIFSFSPSHQELQSRATLRIVQQGHTFSLQPALVQDTGTGQFRGRLYAAWTEFDMHGAAELRLGTSDDNGYQWSSRVIFSADDSHATACPNDQLFPPGVRIAVNREGVLGVLWVQNAQEVLFTSSADGGRTFRSGEVIARHDTGKQPVGSAIPYNEWLLAGEFAVYREGKPYEPFIDTSHLGLSMRMSKRAGIGDFALTADAKNTFHALWAELGTDENHALLTRTIDVAPGAPGINAVLTNTPATQSCAEGVEPLRRTSPSPPPPVDIPGQQDVTGSFNLRIEHIHYTVESHLVTAKVVLMNKGDSVLRGPLSFFGVGVHSDYGVPTALNAAGTKQGQPFWDVYSALPTAGLAPKASCKPIELRFKLEHFQTVPVGDAVAMWVRVYERP